MPKRLTAATADLYDLYQQGIQGSPIIRLLERHARKILGRPPRIFREDFCGTAFNCCEFVKLNTQNRAVGIDLDEKALHWCHKNNFPQMTEDQWDRIALIHGNVITAETEPADFIAALNFSYCFFKNRSLLLSYFKNAKRGLVKNGVLIMDAHGGPDILLGDTYENKLPEFTYVCQGSPVDPITHDLVLKIHYLFPDGSMLREAVQYDFRLWTLPELVEIMTEAGFHHVQVLWEGTNHRSNTPNGIFRPRSKAGKDCYPLWIAYIVGQA